jgi:lipopolysaccharide biosynthesis protein
MVGSIKRLTEFVPDLWRLAKRGTLTRPRNALAVPYRWLRKPGTLSGADVCFFVTYCPSGRVEPHAYFHAKAWAERNFKLILIVALDNIDIFASDQDLRFAAGILLRQNEGYDFGAWAAALRLLPTTAESEMIAITNDSLYGPFNGFDNILARVKTSTADIVGLTESMEVQRHFQSYMLFFKRSAVTSRTFWKFWRRVRGGDRQYVIDQYELRLINRMEAAGLSAVSLFPARNGSSTKSNPTLTRWRELIDQGFPFIKAQLLRENPVNVDVTGWREVIAARGYDPDLISRHLASSAKRYADID